MCKQSRKTVIPGNGYLVMIMVSGYKMCPQVMKSVTVSVCPAWVEGVYSAPSTQQATLIGKQAEEE